MTDMICGACNQAGIQWVGTQRGRLNAFEHTECPHCGGRNTQLTLPPGEQFNELCNRDGCTGVMCMAETVNCSCHITAPCASCDRANRTIECSDCGHTIEEDY